MPGWQNKDGQILFNSHGFAITCGSFSANVSGALLPYKNSGCRKRGNWGEEWQKNVSDSSLTSLLTCCFQSLSRLVTRAWSFHLKGEPNTRAFISFFLSVYLIFPPLSLSDIQTHCRLLGDVTLKKKKKLQLGSRGVGDGCWGQTGGGRLLSPQERWWRWTPGGTRVRRDGWDKDGDSRQPRTKRMNSGEL